MTLDEKVINYKIVDLVKLYNFGIKFVFLRDHMKRLLFFLRDTICRVGLWNDPFLKWWSFPGASDGVIRR